MANDTFLGLDTDLDKSALPMPSEPVTAITSRVLFSLLVSVSLVLNLLLLLAVFRRRRTVHVTYCLVGAMLLPDLLFYAKLIMELMDWGGHNENDDDESHWAKGQAACSFWQFCSHLAPLLYSVLLLAVVYHAFVTLFLDYSGGYEQSSRRMLPLIIAALIVPCVFVAAPSAFYSRPFETGEESDLSAGQFRQYCALQVPSLLATEQSDVLLAETTAAYRLVYEVVLPYLLPLTFLGFPYVCLLLGLMRGVPAASHSAHSTKMTVVVTLWLVTSFLMLHVASVLRGVFSALSVWPRLVAALNAEEDHRVPKFRLYVDITAYAFTCSWGILRAMLCFKYNLRLRKALGP